MLTLGDLTGPGAPLRTLDDLGGSRAGAREVSTVRQYDAALIADGDRHGLQGVIVTVSPNEPWLVDDAGTGVVVAALARRQAAALALVEPPAAVRDAAPPEPSWSSRTGRLRVRRLRRAAARHRVPLTSLGDRHGLDEALRRHADRPRELLEVVARLTHRRRGPQELLGWLGQQIGAYVEVWSSVRELPAWLEPQRTGEVVQRIVDGMVQTARLQVSTSAHVLLHAVGGGPPYQILIAVRHAPYPPAAVKLFTTAAAQVALLLRTSQGEARQERLQHDLARTARAAHTSLWHHLIAGEMGAARRSARLLCPSLLHAGRVRVAVLCCPPDEREAVAAACREALDGALVLPCPQREDQVVAVVPVVGEDHWGEIADRLWPVLVADGGRTLGVSRPTPVFEAAAAHDRARRMAAAGRHRSGLAALDAGPPALTSCLDAEAHRWACAFLRPVLDLRNARELLTTAAAALQHGVSGAAERTGTHRNTVRNRLRRVTGVLGIDAGRLADRAVLDLAVRLVLLRGTAAGADRAPALEQVLAGAEVRRWAERYLAPLRPEGDVYDTVAAWVAADTAVGACAERTGVHRNTVRARLRRAEALLGHSLSNGGGAVHEVALALRVRAAGRNGSTAVGRPPRARVACGLLTRHGGSGRG